MINFLEVLEYLGKMVVMWINLPVYAINIDDYTFGKAALEFLMNG